MSKYEAKGIDISVYQNAIDWDKFKSDPNSKNNEFVIIRAGYGQFANQKDSMFETHYHNAKTRNIPVGAYWYSYAYTEEDAEKEALTCVDILKGKCFEYPIYYDIEEQKHKTLSKDKLSAIAKKFCDTLEAHGYWAGIYSMQSMLVNNFNKDVLNRYAVWIAQWNVSKPTYNGQYGMWQYAVEPTIAINGECDKDICYIDYPTLIKQKGKNGFSVDTQPQEEPKDDKKTIELSVTIDGITYKGTLTEQ